MIPKTTQHPNSCLELAQNRLKKGIIDMVTYHPFDCRPSFLIDNYIHKLLGKRWHCLLNEWQS